MFSSSVTQNIGLVLAVICRAIRITLFSICRVSKTVGADDFLPIVMRRIIRVENFLPLRVAGMHVGHSWLNIPAIHYP